MEAEQTAAGAGLSQCEDEGTGVLSWPLLLSLPIGGMGVTSLVPPAPHPPFPAEYRII